jgi:hypothetical protein
MVNRFLGLGVVVGAVALSCGGSSDTSGAAGSKASGPAIDDVPALLAGTYCDAAQTCYGQLWQIYMQGRDCKTMITAQFTESSFVTLKDAIAKGSAAYHADKVQACLDAIKAEGCALFSSRMPTACKEAIEGKAAAGAACTDNGECAGDTYCKGDTCPGLCTTTESEGADCKSDDACRSGLKCATSTTKKCVKPGGSGAACLDAAECDVTMICLGADKSKAQNGTCKLISDTFKAAVGDVCNVSTGPLCQAGLSCALDQYTPPSTITFKCVAQSSAGGACKLGAPDPCPAGQYCSGTDTSKAKFDGTCAPSPGDGAACAETFGNQCSVGLTCDSTSTCRAQQHIGAVCANKDACYSAYCSNGVCAAGSSCNP